MENQVEIPMVPVWEATPVITIFISIISLSIYFQKIKIRKLLNYLLF